MKKRNVIITGSLILAVALSATAVSTVAWYTGSSNLQVSNFNIQLASKELRVSTDNETFKETLNKEDLMQVDKFSPVSSMFSSSWQDKKSEMPEFRKGFAGKGDPEQACYSSIDEYAIADDGFFSQTLYLKSDSTAFCTIDPEKTSVSPNEEENDRIATKLQARYPEMSHQEILDHLNKGVDSLRISLLILDNEDEHELDDYAYYIIDPKKNGDTYLGAILDNNLDGYYDFYSNKEVLYGEANNISEETLVYTDEGPTREGTSYSVFDASTKSGVKHLDLDASIEAGLDLAQEKSLSLEEAGNIRLSLGSNISKRIVLSFYLEGWDKDNTNLAMYSRFFVNLAFRLADGGNGGK